MIKLIKVVLALFLLLCLLDMPYGFYQLVRFVAVIGFGYLAFHSNQNSNTPLSIIYAALALLFQPFLKIALGRDLWNIVDVVVAVFLIFSIFRTLNSKTFK